MISVILPIYQVENYIEECLNSILTQTYEDIEIICINDCSMDNSITIVKEYMKKDKRVRLVNHSENRGLGGARNTGIDSANGEYILFVDSDDYIHKTMVEKLYHALKEYNADASVCGMMLFTDRDQKAETTFHYDELAIHKLYNISSDKELLTNLWPSAVNKLFSLAKIREYNIRFKERILYEDHTFFYEYFLKSDNFAYIKEPLYFYRKARPLSITSGVTGRENEIFKIIGYISDIFNNNFCKQVADRLSMKIAIRLLYERRWVFVSHDYAYYKYLKEVSQYLSKYDKNYLLRCKDSFIADDDPIFCTPSEVDALERKRKESEKREHHSPLKKIKRRLKTVPVVRHALEKRHRDNEIYWTTWDTWKKLDNLCNKMESLDEKIDNQFDRITSDELGEWLKASVIESEKNTNKRLHDLQVNMNSIKQKNDDIWWLSWNIKDNLPLLTEPMVNDSRLLRYYPTWIPTEYPEYFMGNTWYWADNFKDYFIKAQGNCEKELSALKQGMSEESMRLIDLLWERNTKILPYSQYTDLHGMLLKKDVIFTAAELEEQSKIFKHYKEYTYKYIIPENTVYEIPVFYYEHGLKQLTMAEKHYIMQGDIMDLGAFIGDSAIVLSQYTTKTVYSIEIDSDNIKKMCDVLKLNGICDKTKIINCGIGESNGVLSYYGKESYSTLNNVSDVSDIYSPNKSILVKNIDTLVVEEAIEPHFIKIDIEGMELEAIKGAVNTLKNNRPLLCISIYHTAKDFLFIKPFIESLNLGYTFRIENHNPFDPVYEKMLVAIPPIQ